MSSSAPGVLTHARYGKDKVRVFRIVREPNSKVHHIVEYNVTVLLEGDIETSYTEADNSVVVATDSMKNITYYLAKVSPHILHPTRFALHLGTHLVSKYAHIHKAFITVEQLRWARIGENEGKGHTHSFWRDGDEKKFVKVEVDATKGKEALVGKVEAGLRDLLVLKSTGSAFESFVRDEYTTLVDVDDRIFSTSIDLTYTFKPFAIQAPKDEKKLEFGASNVGDAAKDGAPWDGDNATALARNITLDVFANDESASVQATLYKMAQRILAEDEYIQSVSYALPNKHYIPVDMKYIGVDNLTPSAAEVFIPVSAPSDDVSFPTGITVGPFALFRSLSLLLSQPSPWAATTNAPSVKQRSLVLNMSQGICAPVSPLFRPSRAHLPKWRSVGAGLRRRAQPILGLFPLILISSFFPFTTFKIPAIAPTNVSTAATNLPEGISSPRYFPEPRLRPAAHTPSVTFYPDTSTNAMQTKNLLSPLLPIAEKVPLPHPARQPQSRPVINVSSPVYPVTALIPAVTKCIQRKCRCTYVKFHRQTAPQGPGHPTRPNDPTSITPNLNTLPSVPPSYRLSDPFLMSSSASSLTAPNLGQSPIYNPQFSYPSSQLYATNPVDPSLPITSRDSFETAADYAARYRAQADLLARTGAIPPTANALTSSSSRHLSGMYPDPQHQSRYSGQYDSRDAAEFNLAQPDMSFHGLDNKSHLYDRSGPSNYPSSQIATYGDDVGGYQNGGPFSFEGDQQGHHRRGSLSLGSDGGNSTPNRSQPTSAASSSVHLPLPGTGFQHSTMSASYSDHNDGSSHQRPTSSSAHNQHQAYRPGEGEGGFSNAFGLMSLDDPAVLAGLSQGAPFFDNVVASGTNWADGVTPRPGPGDSVANPGKDTNGLSAPTPSNLKELKEMWKQYMRTPFSGPSLATPLAHTTSDQFGDGTSRSPKRERGLTRVASLPSVKTPDTIVGWDSTRNVNGNVAANGNAIGGLRTLNNPDDLRSYEQAVLARRAPLTLNLVPKRRPAQMITSISPDPSDASASASPLHPPVHLPMGSGRAGQVQAMDLSRPSSSSSSSSLAHAFVQVDNDGRTSQSPHSFPHGLEHGVSVVEDMTRPSFKRLPSQTLVPDYSKRAATMSYARDESALDDGEEGDSVGPGHLMGPLPVGMALRGTMNGLGGHHRQRLADRTRRMSAPTSSSLGYVNTGMGGNNVGVGSSRGAAVAGLSKVVGV
ncbi:hypothetical protein EW146_g6082 [Bondarzewia mesenterica]|uniref:factor independent urate hydroxylase n=1 Tax=Bondarzewia mesenterica TaxID=1095465 RepID=A0A4S4LPQ2_9AGAM|nr:hypothetical protein EW146_g6082 [Bondarzewia mesenterica]